MKIYIVMSVLNGFKNYEGAFATRDAANAYIADKKAQFAYELHEFYVLTDTVR